MANLKLKEKNENINKSGLGDNNISENNDLNDKIERLEKKIGSLNEVAKKISELGEQNQEKVNNDIKAINDWMTNFHQTVQNSLKNLKVYIDKKLYICYNIVYIVNYINCGRSFFYENAKNYCVSYICHIRSFCTVRSDVMLYENRS